MQEYKGFEIRDARKEDYEKLQKHRNEFEGVSPPPHKTVGEEMIVAEVNGELVGFINIGRTEHNKGTIHGLAVKESYQKLHIGSALFRVGRKRLLKKYDKVIFNSVYRAKADKFYRRFAEHKLANIFQITKNKIKRR